MLLLQWWNEVTMTYMSGTNFFQKHQTVCCDICAMHNRFNVEGIRIYVPILQRTNNAYEMKLHRSLVKYFFYNLQTWLPLSLLSYSICFSLSFLHLFRHCYCHNSFFCLSLLSSNLAFPCHNSFFFSLLSPPFRALLFRAAEKLGTYFGNHITEILFSLSPFCHIISLSPLSYIFSEFW